MSWTSVQARDLDAVAFDQTPVRHTPLLYEVDAPLTDLGPWDALRRIRHAQPERILCARSADPDVRARALAAGCQGWAGEELPPPSALESRPVMWYQHEDDLVTFHFRARVEDDPAFEWFREVNLAIAAEARGRIGRPFALLVCMDGLSLGRTLADRYRQEIVGGLQGKYFRCAARYGGPIRTQGIVAMEHLRRAEPGSGNLFPDRESALDHLRTQ